MSCLSAEHMRRTAPRTRASTAWRGQGKTQLHAAPSCHVATRVLQNSGVVHVPYVQRSPKWPPYYVVQTCPQHSAVAATPPWPLHVLSLSAAAIPTACAPPLDAFAEAEPAAAAAAAAGPAAKPRAPPRGWPFRTLLPPDAAPPGTRPSRGPSASTLRLPAISVRQAAVRCLTFSAYAYGSGSSNLLYVDSRKSIVMGALRPSGGMRGWIVRTLSITAVPSAVLSTGHGPTCCLHNGRRGCGQARTQLPQHEHLHKLQDIRGGSWTDRAGVGTIVMFQPACNTKGHRDSRAGTRCRCSALDGLTRPPVEPWGDNCDLPRTHPLLHLVSGASSLAPQRCVHAAAAAAATRHNWACGGPSSPRLLLLLALGSRCLRWGAVCGDEAVATG